jgi:hypothetical protein
MKRVLQDAGIRIVAGLVLVGLAGCGSSQAEPGKKKAPTVVASAAAARPATPPRSPAPRPPAPPKLPAAEFDEPPVLPESEPLPRLVMKPESPAVPPAAQPTGTPGPPSQPAGPAAAGQPANKVARAAFDPIKENGPIFVGWPKPQSRGGTGKAALVITGREDGYIEPCGCAGLDRMKGGMARRYVLFEHLRKEGWPVVGLDVGGLSHGFGKEAVLKYQALVESKIKMGYDAVAFGTDDLQLPAGDLVALAAPIGDRPSMFLDANVGLFGFDAKILEKSRVVKADGMRIGVTAILGKSYQQLVHNAEIEFSDPEKALKPIVPQLQSQADLLVLLAYSTKQEALDLVKKFPQFGVVVVSEGPEEPPAGVPAGGGRYLPPRIPGTKTMLITVGHKGQNAIVLAFFASQTEPVLYQRVPLDSRWDEPQYMAWQHQMRLIMAGFQDQLKDTGLAGLGLRPVPNPLEDLNGTYIGSEKCKSCHEDSYKVWKKSAHAHAYDTLANRDPTVKVDPPRNFDPECISCHVVGWNPEGFFPYVGGFVSEKKTPQLKNVGCEDCHGPGQRHAAVEEGSNEALQKTLRKAVRLTKEEARKQQCVTCHDIDNSPAFDFDKYFPLIEHHEKD